MSDDPIVGHKTFDDGNHAPLHKSEADEIWARAAANRVAREQAMPDEQTAIDTMFAGYLRLKELGWREAVYCPKDGTEFEVIEAGSTGIHRCRYMGDWPNGSWWVYEAGDMWPSRPTLYRDLPVPDKRSDDDGV